MVARPVVLRGAFLDTSVILPGLIDFGARSASAQRLFEAIASGRLGRPRTAWHCCLEFYSVATRLPQEFRLRTTDAVALLESEVLARFEIEDLPPGQRHAFLSECGREGVHGGRLYDAHIAAVARSSGARVVVTDNPRDFAGLERQGIRVLAAAAARQLLGRRTPRRRS
ncbi:MAG TPA: PIN domain-containing protein [Vicinamibacteria bacterium]|nr:PIN domain-containing protein [Vicinamibacteria bacterium]